MYYNKTYGFGGSDYSSYGYHRREDDFNQHLAYQGRPKYRDPFLDTYKVCRNVFKKNNPVYIDNKKKFQALFEQNSTQNG